MQVVEHEQGGTVPLGQPGQGRATYVYAHAREGMFLPLLETSAKAQGLDSYYDAALGMLTSPQVARAFDLPTVERGGGAGTVAADGASYREIFDVADWDRSLAINVPGQSGQPGSPYYDNLLKLWAENEYFPLAFSDRAVRAAAKYRLTLRP